MNRKRRKARKMFLRKYGKATNPYWQAQYPQRPIDVDAIRQAFAEIYNRCK